MSKHFKISLLGLLGVGTAMAGGLSQAQLNQQDALINPYTDTGTKLEMRVNNDKVQIDKNSPKVTFQRWNGADHLDVSFSKTKQNGKTARKTMTKQADYQVDNKETVTMVPTDDGQGFNVDVTLASKPATNVFTYTFDNWQDKDFFYQPALNVEMASSTCTATDCGGAHRPENVVSSYAVYSKVHKDHILGQTNYETGKLFHIYRPLVTDANGSTTWATLDIKNGMMSVTVPQSFLDTAVYPVLVDPTFGYTTVGTATGNMTNSFYFQATAPDNGTLTLATLYGDYQFSSPSSATRVGWYSDNSNVPQTQLEASASTPTYTNNVPAWKDFTLTSSIISGTKYHFGMFGGGSSHMFFYWDTGLGGVSNTDSAGILPATATPQGTNTGRTYSIYATYTASGGGGTTPKPQMILFQ